MTSGVVVWFTGLPSSGKSALARSVRDELAPLGTAQCILDGDEVRAALVPAPGYGEADRAAFYATLGNLAALLAKQGLVVLVPATAHLREYREHARRVAPRFVEVWVSTSAEECARRDSKGLYARARSDPALPVPGVTVAYEPPERPDVVAERGVDPDAVARVLAAIRRT